MRPEDLPRSASITTLNPPRGVRKPANRMTTSADSGEEKPRKLGGLVLTRHLGESIMIGDDVEVEVAGLKSGSARLKVLAPRSIAVHRREVYEEIQTNPTAQPFVNDRPAKAKGALVLTRNLHESIMIGDDVELQVVEVRPTTVKLKIVAPRSVTVHRREVYEAIRNDQG